MNINFGLFPDLQPGSIVKPEGVKRFRGKDKAHPEAAADRHARACRLRRMAAARARPLQRAPEFY